MNFGESSRLAGDFAAPELDRLDGNCHLHFLLRRLKERIIDKVRNRDTPLCLVRWSQYSVNSINNISNKAYK